MRVAVLKLFTDKKFKSTDVSRFRGFMGNFFQDEMLFHNHISKYEFLYQSSKIQYKILDGSLAVVGINEGAELLEGKKEYLKVLQIGEEIVKVKSAELTVEEFELKYTEELVGYTFSSEWFALNSENYEKFKTGEFNLDKQLQNNIIEFFKMVGVWADKPVIAKGCFKQKSSLVKGTKVITFTGTFVANVILPDFIGLGKRKSLGYGSIKKV